MRIHCQRYLAVVPPPLFCVAHVLIPALSTCGVEMRLDTTGIDHQPRIIGIAEQYLQQILPYIPCPASGKTDEWVFFRSS